MNPNEQKVNLTAVVLKKWTQPNSEKNNQPRSLASCKFLRQAPLPRIVLRVTPPDSPPPTTSKSWAIVNMRTNAILFGRKQSRRRQIASLTKIATFLTAIRESQRMGLSPSDVKTMVKCTATGCGGTSANLEEGMSLSLLDLYYGMMLPSGNDAAQTVAELIGGIGLAHKTKQFNKELITVPAYGKLMSTNKGGVTAFISKMNETAKSLGMSSTVFANPSGVSSQVNNMSTAEDSCVLIAEAMRRQIFRQVVGTRQYTCRPRYSSAQLCWENTNKLLAQGWDGVKTGVTTGAGPCLASSYSGSVRGEWFSFGFVLLDCESMQRRWDECRDLLHWVLDRNFSGQ